MDVVEESLDQITQELCGGHLSSLLHREGKGEL